MVTLQAKNGETLYDVAAEASVMAGLSEEPVEFVYEDTRTIVRPGVSTQGAMLQWEQDRLSATPLPRDNDEDEGEEDPETRAADLLELVQHAEEVGIDVATLVMRAIQVRRSFLVATGAIRDRAARYLATFDPQAWVNDHAVNVDPEGDTEWDCTAFLDAHPALLMEIDAAIDRNDEWLDNDDVLRGDPNIPSWAGEWTGPFVITVFRHF